MSSRKPGGSSSSTASERKDGGTVFYWRSGRSFSFSSEFYTRTYQESTNGVYCINMNGFLGSRGFRRVTRDLNRFEAGNRTTRTANTRNAMTNVRP